MPMRGMWDVPLGQMIRDLLAREVSRTTHARLPVRADEQLVGPYVRASQPIWQRPPDGKTCNSGLAIWDMSCAPPEAALPCTANLEINASAKPLSLASAIPG